MNFAAFIACQSVDRLGNCGTLDVIAVEGWLPSAHIGAWLFSNAFDCSHPLYLSQADNAFSRYGDCAIISVTVFHPFCFAVSRSPFNVLNDSNAMLLSSHVVQGHA